MSEHCSNCGFVNPPGMKFCGNCGARLIDPVIPSPVSSGLEKSTEQVPAQIGAMVGSDLQERFRKAGLEAAGQRRNVTVLFVDLSGYTALSSRMDSEDLYELVQKFVSLLANDVYKYEGMVDKFTGDGLMALFGAPIANENNTELALRSAFDMIKDVQVLNAEMEAQVGVPLRVHIGLHSGPVIVGGIGSNLLMNYTAIGDTVNLARRIEDAAAPGTILVSEAAYGLTQRLFDFIPVRNLSLKGIHGPITAYQALGLKIQPDSVRGIEGLRAPMIGRDPELHRLQQAFDELVTHSKGQFTLVVGEAGVGKSRLVSEFVKAIAPSQASILKGHSLTYRRSVSYWIFLDLLRSYLSVSIDTPPLEIRQSLVDKASLALGNRTHEVVPYIENLLSLPPSDSMIARRIELLDGIQLRQQIFLAMRSLLTAETSLQPVVIILEDLHWADEASLELLLFLLETIQQSRMFVIAITRPFQEGLMVKITEKAAGHLGDSFTTIQLQSLSPLQSQELLRQLLSTVDLREDLRDKIIQRSSGVPFYLEEILRMMIDEGLLQRANSHWKLAEGANITLHGVPDSLQGLILTRFDRVNSIQRKVLQVSSVIGRQFDAVVVENVIQQVTTEEVGEALDRLVEKEFILLQPGQGTRGYAFKHAIVSEAIYSTILKKERSEIHGRVGETIERLYAGQLDNYIDILARHFSWSGKKERALFYLSRAAQRSARSYINDQAKNYYEEALELLPQVSHTPAQALQLHMGLGDVLTLVGEYPAARQQYEQCQKFVPAETDRKSSADRSTLFRKIATTYERQADFLKALSFLDKAQQELVESPGLFPIEDAQILNDIGWIHFRLGNMEEAEENLFTALGNAKETSRYDVTASIYNRLGGVYYQMKQLDRASLYVQRSLALREEIGDTVAVARSYNNLGLLDWKRGNWDSALASFMHSLELHANLGDAEGIIDLHGNLGLLEMDRGNIDQALDQLTKAMQIAQQIGHHYIVAMTTMYFTQLFICTEEWEKAYEYGNRSLNAFKEINALDELINVYTMIGIACLGLDQVDSAEQWVQEAMNYWKSLNASPEPDKTAPVHLDAHGRTLRLFGEINRVRQEFTQAENALHESIQIFTKLSDQLELGRSTVALARAKADQKQMTEARVLLNEARLIFRQLGANLDLRKLETFAGKLSRNLP